MNTNPARGMRDFLPEDVRRRQYVMGVVGEVYRAYGFEPLETPAVENIETLAGKYGEEGDRLIFRILKRGEGAVTGAADLALRYDLTVPLARVVAEYRAQLPRFFKRYQMQPVWRADRPQKGRFREFYQCDVDAIGSRSLVIEAELLAAAADVLRRLGFADFVIRVNHRQVLTALLDVSGVPASKHGNALVALDKLDKIGAGGVARELSDRDVLAAIDADALVAVFTAGARAAPEHAETTAAGTGDASAATRRTLVALRRHLHAHSAGLQAVDEVEQIVVLSEAGPAAGHVRLDLSLARGLSYYTGAIFEVNVPDLVGSLAGGGRYDELIGMFSGEGIPACGISLGLERILVVMGERGMFPADLQTRAADVLVTLWTAASASESVALASALRREGLRVEVYPEPDKIGKQLKYADSRGIRCVLLAGDDERARGEVTIKNLGTGVQVQVARANAAAAVRDSLTAARPDSPAEQGGGVGPMN